MDADERDRLNEMRNSEREARKLGHVRIAGLDEAGRGPLAGPVVAAACVFPSRLVIAGIDDSKKLTHLQREVLYNKIVKDKRIHFGIGVVSSEEIDRINIFQASLQAMREALTCLIEPADFLLVDGTHSPLSTVPFRCIVNGDKLCYSIAAASILAKVHRDRLMVEYHNQWPQYGFDAHKGYGTANHLYALAKYGLCPIHRRSFAPVKALISVVRKFHPQGV